MGYAFWWGLPAQLRPVYQADRMELSPQGDRIRVMGMERRERCFPRRFEGGGYATRCLWACFGKPGREADLPAERDNGHAPRPLWTRSHS